MLYLIIAPLLVVGTVVLHAAGFSFILKSLSKTQLEQPAQTWPVTWLLIKVTLMLTLIHFAEILLWASAYMWTGCIPDPDAALYFSGITYTTIGYGDVVLPNPWHILAPVEGLMGILMCGLSTGLFFAVVCRIYVFRLQKDHRSNPHAQSSTHQDIDFYCQQ